MSASLYMIGTNTNSPPLISCNIQCSEPNRPTDSPKTVGNATFSSLILELFLSDFWLFECVFPLALLSLDITCIALWVAQLAMPLYEKWISPSLHCHGDAQLTRQFHPLRICIKVAAVMWRWGGVWVESDFTPQSASWKKLHFIFYNDVMYNSSVARCSVAVSVRERESERER